MEARRKKTSSGELFSFPNTPVQDQDSDFEFGSITPDSPSTFNNSPADHLFVNGRLLPHSFPPQPSSIYAVDVSRAASRTSSVGSKESFLSSRSNSSNSRSSSSCSSSRTSSSDVVCSERSRFQKKSGVSAQVYGSSQRWQFIASVPATVSRENSRRKRRRTAKKKKRRTWFGRRVLRWIIVVCKECHAIEPVKKDDIMRKTKTNSH